MSLRDCINEFITDTDMRKKFLRVESDIELQKMFEDQVLHTKRQVFGEKITRVKVNNIKTAMNAHVAAGGDPYEFLIDELSLGTVRGTIYDADGNILSRPSMEDEVFAMESHLYSFMPSVSEEFRVNLIGESRNKAGSRDLLHVLFDEEPLSVKNNPNMKKYGDEVNNAFERARVIINDYMGDPNLIKFRKNYIPTFHDVTKLQPDKFEEWYKDAFEFTNYEDVISTIRDPQGILVGMSKEELMGHVKVREAYDSIYQAIATGGLSKSNYGKGNVYAPPTKFANERKINFNDSDSYTKYHEKWGHDNLDVMNAIHGTFQQYARDAVAVKKFGPLSQRGFDEILDEADLVAIQSGKGKQSNKRINAQNSLDHIMGNVNSSYTNTAKIISSARALQTLKLGGASITAVFGDTFTAAVAAQMSGLNMTRLAGDMLKNLMGNKDARVIAGRLGLGMEYAVGVTKSNFRFMESSGFGFADKVSNLVVRTTGLNVWTHTAKSTYQIEILQTLADSVGKPFKEVDKDMAEFLSRHGIKEADWGRIQKGLSTEQSGMRLIDPTKLDFEDSQLLVAALSADTRMAIMDSSAKARALTLGGKGQTDIALEAKKAFWQFKTHGASFVLTTLARSQNMKGMSKLAYLGSVVGGLTFMGGMMVAASDVTKGKTPRMDFDNPSFWIQALQRGGGMGILGDVLFNGMTQYKGFSAVLSGAVISDLDRFTSYMTATKDQLMDLEIARTLGKVPIDVIEMTVGNLWHSRIVINKAILQHLRRMNDPEYDNKRTKQLNTLKSNTGQTYF